MKLNYALDEQPNPSQIPKYSLIISVIALLVATIISLFTYFNPIEKREITFSIENHISLIEPTKMQDNRVKVFYDSIQVANIYRIDCKILNSGNKGILKKDYVEAINIDIEKDYSFIRYEIIQNTKNIDVEISIKNNLIEIQPDLLNTGDFIQIAIYYTGKDSNVISKASSRIIDGNFVVLDNVETPSEKNKFYFSFSSLTENILLGLVLTYLIGFVLMCSYSMIKPTDYKRNMLGNIFECVIITFGFVLAIIYILNNEFF